MGGVCLLFYEKKQPVEIVFIDSKPDGSGEDVSTEYFFTVRFTAPDVEPKEREKVIIVDGRVARGCVYFLQKFNPKTFEFAITDPPLWEARRRQEVPLWLLDELVETQSSVLRAALRPATGKKARYTIPSAEQWLH